ncbi:ABC transporter permease [Halobacteriovorax sp.]|uniref:ABC transporter permease n=1 Tax=Halobacteriovorax sp. TaxID=2020862 RepID=UPI003564754A
MKELKHHLSVYRMFVSTSFSQSMSFRLNFFLLILMDIFFYFSSLMTVSFIFDHVQTIGPWNKDQLMFFISFMLCIDHLHMTLISESFWVLSRDIKSGNMDFTILKPISSIFTCFFRHIRTSSICNTIVVWACLIYFGRKVDLDLLSWISLPFLVVLSFTLLAILEFIISTSMFWMTEGMGINFLRMQFQNLSRWPNFIYSSLSRKVFTLVIPILLIGSAPVHFIFDHSAWHYLIYLVIAIVLSFGFLQIIWKRAINQYESASS